MERKKAMNKYLLGLALPAWALLAQASTFRVLTVYTDGAISAAGSEATVIAQITTALNHINTAFSNSGLSHTAISVGYYHAPITSEWGTTTQTSATKASIDQKVRAKRNLLQADMVIVITDNFPTGNIGWTVGVDANNEYLAFSAVLQAEATSSSSATHQGYSYAHEFGHIMGLRHQYAGGQPGTDDTTGVTDSHGFWQRIGVSGGSNNCLHSLMGYASIDTGAHIACIGGVDSRYLHFSNPSVSWQTVIGSGAYQISDPGTGTGTISGGTAPNNVASGRTAAHSYEASVINANAAAVSDFHNHRLKVASIDALPAVLALVIGP
jgi:Metallo-peptidase family M12